MLRSRGTICEHRDKVDRPLAQKLKAKQGTNQIVQIQDTTGSIVSDLSAINNTFKIFYSKLYKSELPHDDMLFNSFFEKVSFPKISTKDQQMLDMTLQICEIKDAIMSMQSGKSSGPDGFPAEFYKKFMDQLAPLLLATFNDSHCQGFLPPTLTQASISLILKKGKNPLSCTSYRPISLLPVDVKILAKVPKPIV